MSEELKLLLNRMADQHEKRAAEWRENASSIEFELDASYLIAEAVAAVLQEIAQDLRRLVE